jgi:hypothetical protein
MGCNLGVRRSALWALGGFRPELGTGEDKDLSWRLKVHAGIDVHFEPGAMVHRRVRRGAWRTWRQFLRFGLGQPGLYRTFRDHGMPRSSGPEAARDLAWLVVAVPGLVAGRNRDRWAETAGLRLGRLVGSLRHQVRYL